MTTAMAMTGVVPATDAPLTGRAKRRADRAAAVSDTAGAAWLALMHRRGRVTTAMLRAALDIRRGQMTDAPASTGVRAIDPTRLVVDGGAVLLNLHPAELGGVSGALGGEARRRWEEYEVSVRGRDTKRAVLRGRDGSLWRHLLVVKVLVDGERPDTLDRRLKVRNGACSEVVLAELAAYADLHRFQA